MAENLSINAGSKEEKYRELLPQLYALISTETDFIANLANLSAALKQTFNFFWVGFYLVKGDELVLGRFKGLSPALVSVLAEEFAARPGKKHIR